MNEKISGAKKLTHKSPEPKILKKFLEPKNSQKKFLEYKIFQKNLKFKQVKFRQKISGQQLFKIDRKNRLMVVRITKIRKPLGLIYFTI